VALTWKGDCSVGSARPDVLARKGQSMRISKPGGLSGKVPFAEISLRALDAIAVLWTARPGVCAVLGSYSDPIWVKSFPGEPSELFLLE
jgi:hypothetical protein